MSPKDPNPNHGIQANEVASAGPRTRPPSSLPPEPTLYEVEFELFPSGHFGVPQPGIQLVRPSGLSDSIVDLATLIRVELRVGEFRARLAGNRLSVFVASTNPEAAHVEAEKAADRFLRFLAMNTGTRFEHRFRGVTSPHGGMIPGTVQGVSQIFFQPDAMLSALEVAGDLSKTSGGDLDRALTYYDHALLLLEIANQVNRGFPKSFWQVEHDYQTWLIDVILNLWKAQAQILGEGKRREKRMALLSIDAVLHDGLEALDELRDTGGVAHTHQVPPEKPDLRMSMDSGRKAVEKLIRVYGSYLSAHGRLPL